jgi:hypothetical protein
MKDSDEDMDKKEPVPTLEEAAAGFEIVQWYHTSFKSDDVGMQ